MTTPRYGHRLTAADIRHLELIAQALTTPLRARVSRTDALRHALAATAAALAGETSAASQ